MIKKHSSVQDIVFHFKIDTDNETMISKVKWITMKTQDHHLFHIRKSDDTSAHPVNENKSQIDRNLAELRRFGSELAHNFSIHKDCKHPDL
ncbi:hypothetical protein NPIL_248921 [Nephila pilipes]|uniref:Uncharacterized protein n=1 Tax=Nephila pilipes TaxID=299642 RepID=A0A8X6TEY4_NEPPI|nr:hypothetical protein NPIL_248921 [Nephila pilipes]